MDLEHVPVAGWTNLFLKIKKKVLKVSLTVGHICHRAALALNRHLSYKKETLWGTDSTSNQKENTTTYVNHTEPKVSK